MTALALPPPVTSPPDDADADRVRPMFGRCRTDIERETHHRINEERAKCDLPRLRTSRILYYSAGRWAALMLAHDTVEHVLDELKALDLIKQSGYPNAWLGQNIAGGQSTPEEVVRAWTESTHGHRETMLSERFTELGVGLVYRSDSQYRWWWSTDFGGGKTPYARRCKR